MKSDDVPDEKSLANAGYAVTGSGGGGAEGRYLYADLAELDGITTEWATLRDRIFARGRKIVHAKGLIRPPAKDLMSQEHAKVLIHSLDKAQDHNDAMSAYADRYVSRLTEARKHYATTDEASAWRLRNAGEG